jgi:putative Mn2+ efflux pump MntP
VLDEQQLTTLAFTFMLALLHALLPSHWLCFVLVGRAHRWSLARTQAVALGAGGAHVLVTALLGALAISIDYRRYHEWAEYIAAGVLAGLGLLYILLHFVHAGHHHERDVKVGDRIGILGLYVTVTVSPCSLIIPVLFGAAGIGLGLFVALIVVLLLTTWAVMAVLVALAYFGIERMRFGFLDRFEKLIIGLVLIGVAASMLLFHHLAHDHDHGSAPRHPATGAKLVLVR